MTTLPPPEDHASLPRAEFAFPGPLRDGTALVLERFRVVADLREA
ncbi:hypothetical protein [Streptomyces sp. DSM 118878]